METLDDRKIDAEEQENKSVKEKERPRKDKGKNKKLGCGLLSLSLLAIIVGIFLGLQLLGIVDVRPIIYKAGGRLPIVGQKFFLQVDLLFPRRKEGDRSLRNTKSW